MLAPVLMRSAILAAALTSICWLGAGISAAQMTGDGVSQAPIHAPAHVVSAGGDHAPDAEIESAQEQPPIAERSLLSIIKDGGVLMIPILVCSFILMVFLFERTISLRRGRVIPEPFVKRFLHQMREGNLDREQAMKLCDESRSPVAAVFAGGVRKWGRPAVEVEQAVVDAGERAVNELRRYLRVFNGVATVGPLLGLLGTVFGMIQCFNEIAGADAMGRPELLAGGISQALLTTAAGLTIAIPALILYMFFLGRVDRFTIDLDSLGLELANMISAEALEAAPKKTVRARRQDAAQSEGKLKQAA